MILSKLRPLMACILLTVSGCHIGDLEFDKVRNPVYSPNAAFLVGNAKYTIRELIDDLDDERLQVNEGNDFFLTFVYTDSASFSNSSDFISFNDVINDVRVEPNISSPVSPIEVRLPIRQVFELDYPSTGNESVDSLFYSSGTLELDVSSSFQAGATYSITILGTRDIETNQDFVYNGSLNYQGFTPVTDQFQVMLAGRKTLLTTGSTQNNFQMIFDGELVIPAGASVSSSDFININLTIRNPNFSAVFGNFGNDQVELQNQSIELDGFQDFGDLGLEIFAPLIRFDVTNRYGLPMGISLNGFKAINNDNSEINLTGSIVDNLVVINAPTTVGNSANTIFEINRNNSNISELLSSTPIRIEIPVLATVNPPGTNATTNFLTDSSGVNLQAEVEIPLELKMDGFSRNFDFDISDFDVDDATSITIRVNTTNQLPLSGSLDIRFVDASNQVLHEITNQTIIDAPSVGGDGRTVGVTMKTTDIVLDQAGINAFVNATKVDATMNVDSFDASNGTFVRIYADYQLELELSFFGQFLIQL